MKKYFKLNAALLIWQISLAIFLFTIFFELITPTNAPKFDWLAFVPSLDHVISSPWVIFTYPFLNTNVVVFLISTILLIVVNQLYKAFFNNTTFTYIFFISCVGGTVFSLLVKWVCTTFLDTIVEEPSIYGLFPSILGLITYLVTIYPRVRWVIGEQINISILWILMVFFFIDAVSAIYFFISDGDFMYHTTNLGAILTAHFFAEFSKPVKDRFMLFKHLLNKYTSQSISLKS